ncbi:sensor histidine kinase [Paenibacillus sp. 1P07SE]|uniref:sensor histidine kinase n=1 Tax=Paenibacillus sp. 1P07SE TaxID=3132209 RepID=UPI0039A652DF
MKLKYKVTAAFAILIVAPFLVVGWLSAYTATDTMMDELGRTTLQLVMQNHVTIEKTMSAVNDRTTTFLDNYFFGSTTSVFWQSIETLGDIRHADAILEGWSSNDTDFSLYMINVFGKEPPIDLSNRAKGFNYLNQDASNMPGWTRHAIQAKGAGSFRLVETEEGKTEVRFMRSILNAQRYDQTIGFLVVSNMKPTLARDLLSVRLPEHAGLFLFNELDEQLLRAGAPDIAMDRMPDPAKGKREGYYFAEQNGKQWLFAYSSRSAFDTRLVYQIPLESITGNQTRLQWLMMVASGVYLACVLLYLLYLLRIIVNPLSKLVSLTRIYEPGKPLDVGEDPPRADEFGILYGAILKMTRRLNQSFEENYVMKIKQKENELNALHSQITPHLLYNTLDSIYWYALDSGNTGVGEMVKDLSKLLRIGLSKGRTMITLGEELEHALAYCRLQAQRYPDTFEATWDIDEAAKLYMTPKVILQPLIENAIFHAVSGMDGEGEVLIRVRLTEDNIEMAVEDNGFVPVELERMNKIVRGEINDAGFGIRNVHQRIQLHFGDSYGLCYEHREGGGTAAWIRIPLQLPEGGRAD